MKTFNIILIECQCNDLSLQSFQVFLFILIHQIADLLVHLAEEINITVCSWVDYFILHKLVHWKGKE